MARFTDKHRLFVQAVISRRLMTVAVAEDVYKQVCNATQDADAFGQEDFSDFIAEVNEGLNGADLEIRKAADEITGIPVMALTNTNGEKIAQVATSYNPTELEYFKHLLDLIVTADDEVYCISSTAALHETGRLKNKEDKPLSLTKREAELILDRFVADKWLIRSTAGAYSLSMRALLELQTYLKETYDEQIQECTLCMEIITKGQRCTVAACSTRLHHHCAKAYFQNMNNPSCPSCRSAWTGKILIGLSNNTSAPSTIRKQKNRKNRDPVPVNNAEDDDDDEDL